jgi:hypothetical protein
MPSDDDAIDDQLPTPGLEAFFQLDPLSEEIQISPP